MPTHTLTIDGREERWQATEGERLLDGLRRNGHTDVKEGCSSGECGACTVLLDGQPVCSCLTFTAQAEGHALETPAGLGRSTPELLASLVEQTAVQCGFCTPGIVASASALLRAVPTPDAQQVRDALEGHLCRCTGYHRVIAAVQACGRHRASPAGEPPTGRLP